MWARPTAFPHRTPGFNFLVIGEWMEPAATATNVAWVRESYAAMPPHFASGRYVNYLNADEVGEQSQAASWAELARLREVKRRYDPENQFHMNQNIRPQTVTV